MNKQGQQKLFGLMIAMTIIVLGLALAFPTSDAAERARNESSGDVIGMDCQNSSISNVNRVSCIVVEIMPFYFIGTLIFIAGGFVSLRIIFS